MPLTREQARQRAHDAQREAFEPTEPEPVGQAVRRVMRPQIIKQGWPAPPEAVTVEFRAACDDGITARRIIAMNPPVPEPIAALRIQLCETCHHATIMSTRALICEAVECPRWRWIDRCETNRHEGALCPIGLWLADIPV